MTKNEIILLYTERKAYAKGQLDANTKQLTDTEKLAVSTIIKLLDQFIDDLKQLNGKISKGERSEAG